MRRSRDPKAEAKAWFERVGHAITTADLTAFWAWRDDPAHDAAYREVGRAGMRMRGRFVVTPDPHGFSVIDTWTRDVAIFAEAEQSGISVRDPEDICEILNRRTADGGERQRRN